MHIDWWTLGLQTINLLVLVWILSRFLFRPISEIIRQRQAAAEQILEKASAERARADEEETQAARDKEEAEQARGQVLHEAESEAESEKAKILADARKEAEELRVHARAEIERLRKDAEARSAEQASRLAVQIAGKLFERLPDSAKVDGFIDGLAEGIAKLPERTRDEIGGTNEVLTVNAVRAMTADEITACNEVLAKAVGHDVTIDVGIDPGLIAGLELDTPFAVVRNSFRADLDRIAQELTGNGRG